MDKIMLAILPFIFGFWAKKFFDNRDLRRKILEPVFLEFEAQIIYLQHKWREKQRQNINNKDYEACAKEYNFARDELIRFNNELIYACKKIREEKLINLTNEAVETLRKAISSYEFFVNHRDKTPPDERGDLIIALDEANSRFDESLPKAMEMVYDRYWVLISSVFVSELFFQTSEYFRGFIKGIKKK